MAFALGESSVVEDLQSSGMSEDSGAHSFSEATAAAAAVTNNANNTTTTTTGGNHHHHHQQMKNIPIQRLNTLMPAFSMDLNGSFHRSAAGSINAMTTGDGGGGSSSSSASTGSGGQVSSFTNGVAAATTRPLTHDAAVPPFAEKTTTLTVPVQPPPLPSAESPTLSPSTIFESVSLTLEEQELLNKLEQQNQALDAERTTEKKGNHGMAGKGNGGGVRAGAMAMGMRIGVEDRGSEGGRGCAVRILIVLAFDCDCDSDCDR